MCSYGRGFETQAEITVNGQSYYKHWSYHHTQQEAEEYRDSFNKKGGEAVGEKEENPYSR